MMAKALGEPVCVAGRQRGVSTLRMRFEVDRGQTARVELRYGPPGTPALDSVGRPARVWHDNHVVAGVDLASSELRESERLTLELWTAEARPHRIWRRDVVIERLDPQQGLHHLSLLP